MFCSSDEIGTIYHYASSVCCVIIIGLIAFRQKWTWYSSGCLQMHQHCCLFWSWCLQCEEIDSFEQILSTSCLHLLSDLTWLSGRATLWLSPVAGSPAQRNCSASAFSLGWTSCDAERSPLLASWRAHSLESPSSRTSSQASYASRSSESWYARSPWSYPGLQGVHFLPSSQVGRTGWIRCLSWGCSLGWLAYCAMRDNEKMLDWKCEIVTQLLHLLLVLCDGARLLKNRWAVDAAHDNGTFLKYLTVDSLRLADIMDDVLFDHSFCLRLVDW